MTAPGLVMPSGIRTSAAEKSARLSRALLAYPFLLRENISSRFVNEQTPQLPHRLSSLSERITDVRLG
jgi:hypothetical protein